MPVKPSFSRRPISVSAISRTAATDFDRRTMRRNCSSRRRD